MNEQRVLIAGPTPPPYHGVAVFVRALLASENIPGNPFVLEHLDTSDRRDASNLGRWDAGNLALGFSNLATLALRLLRRRHALVYVPVSQNVPAFLRDALFIVQARMLGARVVVTVGEHTQAQMVLSQSSYYSHNDLRLHFGLGEKQKADRVTIYWPSGQVEIVPNVAANQVAVIKEGIGVIRK